MKALIVSRDTLIQYVKPEKNSALISISTPTTTYDKAVPTEGWLDCLELSFMDMIWDDLNQEQKDSLKSMFGDRIVLFDEQHAEKVIGFIERHRPANFVVHCDAGISRSVAVGAFMRDFYGYSVEFAEIGTDKYRNIQVYNNLRRVKYGITE